jgi:hypothetical protein
MEPDDRIRRWADAATERLRGDAELRLGIRAALIERLSALAEAIRRRTGSREKGVRLALSTSGAPAIHGAALAASVAPFARRRARTRRLVLAVLVPAAVLVTLLVFGIRSSQVRPFPYSDPWDIFHPLIDMGELIPLFPKPVEPIDLYPNLAPGKDDGTSPEESITNHLREACKARPQDRALHAQLIYHLTWACPRQEEIEAALREGEAIDPENAFYPFIRCSEGLRLDVRWHYSKFTGKNDFREIWSRDGLERDMAGVLRAIGKSHCRRYRLEAMSNWMKEFAEPGSFRELVRRGSARSIIGRRLCQPPIEALALAAPRYARLLISEGRSAEALPYLKAWHPLILEYADDADAPGEWIGIHWALNDIVRYSASFQDDPLFSEEGRRMGALAEAFDQSFTAAENKSCEIWSAGNPYDKRKREKGLMTLWMHPFDWFYTGNEDASFGRRLEHGLLDQVGVLCAAAAGLLLLAGAALAAARWRLRRGPKARPLLLLPGWKDLLRILGLSVALPAALYFAYSRWSCFGGRELTLHVLADRFALELTLLGLAVFTLLLTQASAHLRERCRRLRIDVPAPGRRWPIRAWWGALAAAGLACLVTRDHPGPWPSFVALLLISVFTFAVSLRLGRILFGGGIHRFFHGTLARSLVPFLAAGLFLVGPVFQAALSLEERMLVRADPTIRVDPKEGLWTVPEVREVRRLKQEFQRAAAEAEAMMGFEPGRWRER